MRTSPATRASRRAILATVKQAIRAPYAWPGGYALHVLMQDGEALCVACARAEFRQLAGSLFMPGAHSGWEPAGAAIHWEGADLACCHCGAALPSEYGEVS